MLIEETYEVVETIDDLDYEGLKRELGDLLLHVAMHSTIGEETRAFSLREVLEEINTKLIHRHPHVFGRRIVRDAEEVRQNWEQLKMTEGRTSVLEGVPKGLPALQQALRIQERAARVGFDWKSREDVWQKVVEELHELKATLHQRSKKRQEDELGDFLFSVVNYARKLGMNPEGALRGTIRKFVDRFCYIEKELVAHGKDINHSTLEEMDILWTEAKHRKSSRRKTLRRVR
jgi:XTP/dITP diphosphohydrolase